jgi:hypothetical protein
MSLVVPAGLDLRNPTIMGGDSRTMWLILLYFRCDSIAFMCFRQLVSAAKLVRRVCIANAQPTICDLRGSTVQSFDCKGEQTHPCHAGGSGDRIGALHCGARV